MDKKLIVIRTTIIAILFFLIFLLAYVVDNFANQSTLESKPTEPIKTMPFQMEYVTEYSAFFNIVNNLNNFLNYHQKSNSLALLAILHPQFIKDNNIGPNNVMQFLDDYGTEQLSFKVKNMYFQKNNNNYIYYVKGDIMALLFENQTVVKTDAQYLVTIDYDNITYAVYPLKDAQEEHLPLNAVSIEPNEYNQFQGTNVITNNYICNLYYSEFYNILQISTADTYNLLDQKFREDHFKNLDNYLSFIEPKLTKISSEIAECQLSDNGQRVYKIKDRNYNIFTFTEESIMNYKVKFTLN